MFNSRPFLRTVFSLVFLLSVTCSAKAISRAWVSVVSGSDANPCTRSSPCFTFNAALAVVDSGGEILVLDSGGYNPMTITKSVSVIVPEGLFVGISPSSGNAINIAAGDSDKIVIRGLTLAGKNIATRGINVGNFGSLHLDNVKITGFTGSAIYVAPTGSGAHYLSLKDVNERECDEGVTFVPTGSLSAVIDTSRFEKNNFGITGASLKLTLRGSVVSGNVNAGVSVFGSGSATETSIVESTISHNGSHGIVTNAFMPASSFTKYWLTLSSISNNGGCGVFVNAPAVVFSTGSNLINGNTGGNICGGTLTPIALSEK